MEFAILIAIAIGVSVVSKISEMLEDQKRKSAFGKAPRSKGDGDDIDMDELIRQLNSQSGSGTQQQQGQARPEYTQPGAMTRAEPQPQHQRRTRQAVTVSIEEDPWDAAAREADSSDKHLPHSGHDHASRQWEERGASAYSRAEDKKAAADQAVLWDKLHRAREAAMAAQNQLEASTKKAQATIAKAGGELAADHRRVVKRSGGNQKAAPVVSAAEAGSSLRIRGSKLSRAELRKALITKEIFEPRWKQY